MKTSALVGLAFSITLLAGLSNALAASCADSKTTKQAVICLEARIAAAARSSLPEGMLAFFRLASCPPGWRPADDVRGRYVVAVSAPGALGATVGTPLTDREDRPTGQHSHPFRDRYQTPNSSEGELLGGVVFGSYPYNRNTKGVPGAKEGTNAPYIQLLACTKTR